MKKVDYNYDVFLSYKHHKIIIDWTEKFVEIFSYWLSQEMGGTEPRIFFDKESIETGDLWPQSIMKGIHTSKCILCIWSPQYFKSSWCLSEWMSFEQRERSHLKGEYSIIFPIRFHDGEFFPDYAKKRQIMDFREYTLTLNSFWRSEKALCLEEKIKELSKIIAKAVMDAPSFSPNFPIMKYKGYFSEPKYHLLRLSK